MLVIFVVVIAVALLLVSYSVGRSNGYDDAMKKNGWRPTLNGWHKETPTKPPPPQPSLHDYVDPSDFE